MTNYEPILRENPKCFTGMASAWGDIPTILKDIITRFNLKTDKALEFGVEYGYSTTAIANYFDKVIGVDTFVGDDHTGNQGDHYEKTKNDLAEWKNITLVRSLFEDYVVDNNENFDFIHIDIIHNYEPTYDCGAWSVNHSPVTVFHDTHSFPNSVGKAVKDLARDFNLSHLDYAPSHGLGILVNPKLLPKK